jgi:hypothetical protein
MVEDYGQIRRKSLHLIPNEDIHDKTAIPTVVIPEWVDILELRLDMKQKVQNGFVIFLV